MISLIVVLKANQSDCFKHQLSVPEIDFSFKKHSNIDGKEDSFESLLETSWLMKNFGRKLLIS